MFASRSGSVVFNGLDIAKGVTLLPVFSSTNLVLVATNAPPITWSPVTLTETNRSISTPTGPAKFFRMMQP